MKTDPAKSRARKARRVEKAAENQKLAYIVNPEAGVIYGTSEQAQDATPRHWGSRDVTLPINQPKARKSNPRRKKSLFVRLRNQLDKEAQAYAVERDKQKGCRIRKAAQCTGNSEVGYHILPRGKWAVRWDLDFMGVGNIVGSCAPCNAGERWHRLDYAERHRELFGLDFCEGLWNESKRPYHYTSLDLEKKLDDISERVKKLRQGP